MPWHIFYIPALEQVNPAVSATAGNAITFKDLIPADNAVIPTPKLALHGKQALCSQTKVSSHTQT